MSSSLLSSINIESCKPSTERYSYFPLNVVSGFINVKSRRAVKIASICALIEGKIMYQFPPFTPTMTPQSSSTASAHSNQTQRIVTPRRKPSSSSKKEEVIQVFSRTRAIATIVENNNNNSNVAGASTASSSSSPSSPNTSVAPANLLSDTFASIDLGEKTNQNQPLSLLSSVSTFDTGSIKKATTLNAGEHTFEFSAVLPAHALPSSAVEANGMKMEISWAVFAVISFVNDDVEDVNHLKGDILQDEEHRYSSCDIRVYSTIPLAQWKTDTLQFRKYHQPITCCCFEQGILSAEIILQKTLLALAEDDGLLFRINIDNTDGTRIIEAVTCTMSSTVRPKNFTRLKKNFLHPEAPVFSTKAPLRETFFTRRFQMMVSPGNKQSVFNRIELHALAPATIESPVLDINWHFTCVLEEEGAFASNAEFHFDVAVYHYPDATSASLVILDEQRNFTPLTGEEDPNVKEDELIPVVAVDESEVKPLTAAEVEGEVENHQHHHSNNIKRKTTATTDRNSDFDDDDIPLVPKKQSQQQEQQQQDSRRAVGVGSDDHSLQELAHALLAGRGTVDAEPVAKLVDDKKTASSPKINPLAKMSFTAFPDSDFFQKADKQSKALW